MQDELRSEWLRLATFSAIFAALYFVPIGNSRFNGALLEALHMSRDYAREHVVLCLLPAFWISGAIATFVSQGAVLRYMGPKAPPAVAYGVASVSGTILAVCSCTVLPLFAGIYRMGAGLGPASAFLYSGPAINVLAIVMTAKVLGFELGLARGVVAVVFSVLLGVCMARLFRREQSERVAAAAELPEAPQPRPLWQTASFFATMIAILVFANWGDPKSSDGFFAAVRGIKWHLVSGAAVAFAVMCWRWIGLSAAHLALTAAGLGLAAWIAPGHPELAMLVAVAGLALTSARSPGEGRQWFDETWNVTKLIFPLLIAGVLAAGLLLGRPGHEALIPGHWIATAVGGNSLAANAFASVAGTLMYFATLTEVPILEGLLGSGMGKGAALALMLAGPALSLPSLIVLRSILGAQKTLVFALLVVLLATLAGWLFGFVAQNPV